MSLCYKKEGYEKRVKGETIGLPMKEGYAKRAKGKPLVFARRKDMRSEQRGNHWPSHEGRSNKETIGLPTKEGGKGETIGFPLPLVSPYQNQPDFINFLRRVVLRLFLRFPPF